MHVTAALCPCTNLPTKLVGQRWLKVGVPGKRGKHGMQVLFFRLRWDVDWFEGTVLYTLLGMERRFGRSLQTLGESVCFFLFWEGLGMGCFMFQVRSLFSGRGDEE